MERWERPQIRGPVRKRQAGGRVATRKQPRRRSGLTKTVNHHRLLSGVASQPRPKLLLLLGIL
jgi:hypothetical protein